MPAEIRLVLEDVDTARGFVVTVGFAWLVAAVVFAVWVVGRRG